MLFYKLAYLAFVQCKLIKRAFRNYFPKKLRGPKEKDFTMKTKYAAFIFLLFISMFHVSPLEGFSFSTPQS